MTLRLSTLVGFASSIVVVTSACGGGGGEKSAQAPAARQSTTANQINPKSRDQLKDGGKLTWPIDSMPANFNYNELDGTTEDSHDVMFGVMPMTFLSDASGMPHWDHDYLVSEPVLVTDPTQVVTYEINPKSAWDDGTPITWEDFFWQWKASSGTVTVPDAQGRPSQVYKISSANGYEDIESVAKGKDEREVIVTFKHKYADWQAIFNPVYPASTNRTPKVFNDGWKDRPLTTAGPFRLDRIDLTAKTITFVRNEKWWGDPAKLDAIVYRVIEADAQIDALANGEIDFMDIGPDANKYHRAQGIAGVDVRVAGGPNYRHITINGTSPNVSDVRVRQAIAMAIDRAAIARALLGPLGVAPEPLNNHIFMANQTGYQDNAGDIGKYNPDKARQLLDEAGWKLEGAVRRKDGKPLELTFVIPTAVATSKQETELMQNMLAQVGITVKITAVPLNDFFDKYITPGQFDATVFSWMGTSFPISSSKSIYAKPKKNAKGELDIQQNYARIGSDEIDALFDQANAELDRTKATAIANHIDALLWQEVHSITQYQRPELVACKVGLANFGAVGFADRVYQDIGWAR